MKPFLSIVIANYNYGRFMEEAIRSVITQSSFEECELIVVDGGSIDNSVEIIKKYEDRIAWWCSEKDNGQSDAFNKGFAKASGRFLTWLNADDVMLPGTVRGVQAASRKHPDCQWFAGGSLWLDPAMKILSCHPVAKFSDFRSKCGSVHVWGPSSFFSKELFERVGGVDVRFHYMMDIDLWVRFARLANAKYLPSVRYAFGLRLHPDAKMSGHNFAESAMSNSNHPKWNQIRQESRWINERFCSARLNLVTRILTLDYMALMRRVVDSVRFIGKPYMQVFCGREV